MAVQLKPFLPMDLIEKITNNNFSYISSYSKKIVETDNDIVDLQDKEDTFRQKLKALKRYSPGGTSKELTEKRIEDFLKSYNELESNSTSITDKDIKKQISKLKNLFSEHEKDLRKIGITREKGKYTLNNKAFANAKDKAIDKLFVGTDSFIAKADKIMRRLEDTTDGAEYSVVERNLNKTTKYKKTDVALAANITLAGSAISALQKSNTLIQAGFSDSEFQSSIKDCLGYVAKSIYNANNTSQVDTIDKLNQLCLDHKEDLAKIGLTFDSENKKMSFDDTIDLTTSEFKDAYNNLFGENATFITTAAEDCKSIINSLLQPEKIGVSIIDQHI